MIALTVGFAFCFLLMLGVIALNMVLARRLRAVEERVNLFLPAMDGGLPSPGTPLPEFSALATDGRVLTEQDLRHADQLFAILTTDCASCRDQVSALREYSVTAPRPPLVVVAGPPDARRPMIDKLGPDCIVAEEDLGGAIAAAFEISEFPAVIMFHDGYVRSAEHGVASVLRSDLPVA